MLLSTNQGPLNIFHEPRNWVLNTASVLVLSHGAESACRWWVGLAEYPLGELKQVAAPGFPVVGMVINVPNVRNVMLLGKDMHRL